MLPIEKMQKAVAAEGFDGWLFYDFHGLDPLAWRILQIPADRHLTRRWFYLLPKSGTPIKLVHRIETEALDHLPGEKILYAGWKELNGKLRELLSGVKRVAMHYSPENAIPYVSRVDAGTLELIRKTGVEVGTAADLIQAFEAVLTEEQHQSHFRASKILRSTVDKTFDFVARSVSGGKKISEYDVQEFIWDEFAAHKLVSDSRPIVAIGPHSGDPHYTPEKDGSSPVTNNGFLLIDIWAKETTKDAVYADITWTGYIGKTVPDEYKKIFDIVAGGRDAGLELVRTAVQKGEEIPGRLVDDATREFITKKGYGEYFVHRTGHNIGTEVHGNGANIDNFESREERKLLPQTCFSIEPGVYLPEFGIRSEIDVYLNGKEACVYSDPIQTEVIPILG